MLVLLGISIIIGLGFIGGLITGLILTLYIFNKNAVIIEKIEKNKLFKSKGKGAIILPKLDTDIIRNELIEANDKKGIDTKISELL